MKDFNDMNTLLSRAKYEADRFFSKYNNESLRKSVFARIRQKKEKQLETLCSHCMYMLFYYRVFSSYY